jgi:hypothetical protein
VDGNRRISIFKENDLHVWAIFTDMLVINDLKSTASDTDSIPDNFTEDLEKK